VSAVSEFQTAGAEQRKARSAKLVLVVGLQTGGVEGERSWRNVLFWDKGRKKTEGNRLTQIHLEIRPLNRRGSKAQLKDKRYKLHGGEKINLNLNDVDLRAPKS